MVSFTVFRGCRVLTVDLAARVGRFDLQVACSAHREILALVGPSGAGKTLTLQCIAGLRRPHAGRIVLHDRVLFDSQRGVDVPARARRVGYVFQHYALFPHLTVAQNIAFGLHGRPASQVRRRVDELVALLRLSGLEDRRPHQLSGGQQQRVALGRALAPDPELLLLDEPFSALDPVTRAALVEDFLAVQREIGLTTVLVTHDIYEAYTISDQIVVLEAGRVLQAGPKADIFHRPSSVTVARLTGIRNVFVGKVVASDERGLTIATPRFELLAPPGPYAIGEYVQCCLRPEDVILVRPDRARGWEGAETLLSGTIVRELDHGTVYTLFFRIDQPSASDRQAHDLEIRLGGHTYRVLGIAQQKEWTVALRRVAVHVIGRVGPECQKDDVSPSKHVEGGGERR